MLILSFLLVIAILSYKCYELYQYKKGIQKVIRGGEGELRNMITAYELNREGMNDYVKELKSELQSMKVIASINGWAASNGLRETGRLNRFVTDERKQLKLHMRSHLEDLEALKKFQKTILLAKVFL